MKMILKVMKCVANFLKILFLQFDLHYLIKAYFISIIFTFLYYKMEQNLNLVVIFSFLLFPFS